MAFLNVGIKGMKKGSKKAGFSEHLQDRSPSNWTSHGTVNNYIRRTNMPTILILPCPELTMEGAMGGY